MKTKVLVNMQEYHFEVSFITPNYIKYTIVFNTVLPREHGHYRVTIVVQYLRTTTIALPL